VGSNLISRQKLKVDCRYVFTTVNSMFYKCDGILTSGFTALELWLYIQNMYIYIMHTKSKERLGREHLFLAS